MRLIRADVASGQSGTARAWKCMRPITAMLMTAALLASVQPGAAAQAGAAPSAREIVSAEAKKKEDREMLACGFAVAIVISVVAGVLEARKGGCREKTPQH